MSSGKGENLIKRKAEINFKTGKLAGKKLVS